MPQETASSSAAANGVVVTRVAEDRWGELRAVRLAALADAPSAFGSNLRREQDFDEDRWREWARSAAVFVAVAQGAPVGIVGCVAGDTGRERRLVAMWVAPQWRGCDTASKLMGSAIRWARSEGARRITLWVTEGNQSAHRLYLRYGFAETGDRKPLPSNPSLNEAEMALDLP